MSFLRMSFWVGVSYNEVNNNFLSVCAFLWRHPSKKNACRIGEYYRNIRLSQTYLHTPYNHYFEEYVLLQNRLLS
jgi:hypothetical protein